MRLRLSLAAVLFTALALGYSFLTHPRLHVLQRARVLPADGRAHQLAILTTRFHLPTSAEDLQASGSTELQQIDHTHIAVVFRTRVEPGALHITITGQHTRLTLTTHTQLDPTDTFADGTPDFLRLHTAEDRAAFRRWFTTLAERAADMPDAQLARDLPEITDCASLLRYSYRESLRTHDDRWYAQFPPGTMPALASVEQWTYPNTPLGVGLFRIKPGAFTASDLDPFTTALNTAAQPRAGFTTEPQAFAQFADAKTLYTLNAYRLGRNLSAARPGDLIFYRLLESDSQYHSMIVTGVRSEWVVYHTGPINKHRGEMRRVLLSDLLHHPDPRWRPSSQNPNFLGVYRWNILREQ